METHLLDRQEVADETMAFFLEKPAGFIYQAGQSLNLTLIDPSQTDGKGNTRLFSLVSAPHEPMLEIATRIRDSVFKQVLKSLSIGTKLACEGPFGSTTLHRDSAQPAVFLAGGIGITPFISMLRDNQQKSLLRDELPREFYLFYSNRRPEDAPFLDELQAKSQENPHLHLIATMTDLKKNDTDWVGETGYIDQAMLEKYLPQPNDAIYYLAGPSPMVKAMLDLLQRMEIDELHIKTEEFTGY